MSKKPKPRVTFNGLILHCWLCANDFAIGRFLNEECPNCKTKFEIFER